MGLNTNTRTHAQKRQKLTHIKEEEENAVRAITGAFKIYKNSTEIKHAATKTHCKH